MATVAATDTVNIVINDVDLQVPKGELVVEAVKRLGHEIPIFCYHPRMKPVGMCRMCLVEVGFKQPDGSVRKMPKPQAGCTLPVSEGMVIYTDTEMVHRDRKGVLEFLLINHPLDCPVCDRGGECPLQNNTIFYGPSTSRYIDIKRHAPKAFPLSEYVTLDLERCIQCGRCVRFTEEISGDAQLAFRFRGAAMQPSTFKLTDFDSKFSGNVIEICPVGALTSSKYRFRARPWDLETSEGLCLECGNGCNVWLDHRAAKLVRVNGRTNEAINEEWTCDKGKFGHDYYNSSKRLTQPLRREGDRFVPVSWGEAYAEIAAHLGAKSAALVGSTVSNEGLFCLQKLFKDGFGSENIDHRWTRTLPAAGERVAKRHESSIASLEHKKTVLVFGADLANSQPIVHLRVRKGWFLNETRVVVAHSQTTDADSFANLLLSCKPGSLDDLAMGLERAVAEAQKTDVQGFASFKDTEKTTSVKESALREVAAMLLEGNASIVCTASIYNENKPVETLAALAKIAAATGAEFNVYAEGGNDEGAMALGVMTGRNTHEILQACAMGDLNALWLVGADPLTLHPSRRLAEDALEAVPFLVYQGLLECEAMGYASIVLPMEAPGEHDGTYTNIEGRVQRMQQAVKNPGDGKPAWRVFSELLVRIKPGRPSFSAKEIMDEIAATHPAFAEATYDKLEKEGTPLKPVIENFYM